MGRVLIRSMAITVAMGVVVPTVVSAQGQAGPVAPAEEEKETSAAPLSPLPPAPVATAPAPAPAPAPMATVPVYATQPGQGSGYALSPAVPTMLGTGLAVLGGFSIAGLTLVLTNNDFSDIDAGGVTLFVLGYIVSAAIAGMGLYLMFGGMTGAVEIDTRHPGWAWTAAIASILGAAASIGAVTTALVDDDIGDDTIGLGVAGGAFYLMTLLVLVGLDNSGSPLVGVAPVPLPGGAALALTARL